MFGFEECSYACKQFGTIALQNPTEHLDAYDLSSTRLSDWKMYQKLGGAEKKLNAILVDCSDCFFYAEAISHRDAYVCIIFILSLPEGTTSLHRV